MPLAVCKKSKSHLETYVRTRHKRSVAKHQLATRESIQSAGDPRGACVHASSLFATWAPGQQGVPDRSCNNALQALLIMASLAQRHQRGYQDLRAYPLHRYKNPYSYHLYLLFPLIRGMPAYLIPYWLGRARAWSAKGSACVGGAAEGCLRRAILHCHTYLPKMPIVSHDDDLWQFFYSTAILNRLVRCGTTGCIAPQFCCYRKVTL